jgi:pyruvate kinase
MERRARIVATIGPASRDEQTLRMLLEAGVDIIRLNFSHGEHADHAEVYHRARAAAQALGRPVTILQDLQGPKIRVGEIAGGAVTLQAGQTFSLYAFEAVGDAHGVSVDVPKLPEAVEPGGRILLDDGSIELHVMAIQSDRVETRVVVGGVLKPNKGVNLPRARLSFSGMTEKDEADLAFGLQLGVDAVAISFVHTADDIHRVRRAIQRLAPDKRGMFLIAKLERPEALDNLEAIIDEADGVMVARGDLGVEMAPETVPIAQKRIIELANGHAKVVITATQMLESMIQSPRPTRAEASDVANAIFDGTDAVMLSGETAAGKYPMEAVRMMDAIVTQAEEHLAQWGRWGGVPDPGSCEDDTYYTTRAADALARDRNVAALAAFTETGLTARMLAKHRPRTPILAFTPYSETYQRLNLFWGVTPYLIPRADSIDEMLRIVEQKMLEASPIEAGQQVVLVCGYPIAANRPANLAMLHTVGYT